MTLFVSIIGAVVLALVGFGGTVTFGKTMQDMDQGKMDEATAYRHLALAFAFQTIAALAWVWVGVNLPR